MNDPRVRAITDEFLESRQSAYVPHDPPEVGWHEGQRCPLCDETWPCAERRRQRYEKRWIISLLRSALYEPVRPLVDINGVEALRFQSPLAWYADMTYGEHGLVMVVHTPTGDVRSDDATREWLDEVLP